MSTRNDVARRPAPLTADADGARAAGSDSSVERALARLRRGSAVVVVDSPHRRHEGALIVAAEHVDAAAVNFMATHARGLICLCLTGGRCDELRIPPMTHPNDAVFGMDFMMPIEARAGTTTGISAADRARTIRVAVDPRSRPESLVRPGHVIVLRGRAGGVLERPGHTEAAIDLARLAGGTPAAVLCKIMGDDGSMARTGQLRSFSERHGLPLVRVQDLVCHRLRALNAA